ncbi:MAG: hypothetical protein JEZ08_23815 [Clostridiales bacterium]|nr:hypothetical protein [Clostridiales bacterium]
MSGFNNDDYLKLQVEKQVENTLKTDSFQALPAIDVTSDVDLLSKDIVSLQEMVKNDVISYEDIVSFYLNRIKTFECYNSVLEINDLALGEAKEKFYHPSHDMMYGIPVLIKGNIGTKRMHTTAGAAALKTFVCDDDADIVRKLKKRGAIILGKTNLSEWANFMSTESSNGYSALGGQTMNPYGPFDVGGSSSGSAVAVACQLSPVTIGTETAGSIIYPASQNSVVGLKPTLGVLSTDRIIPISESHDTAGPMARTVKDTYYLFKAISDIKQVADFKKDALKNIRIGVIINEPVLTYYREGDEVIIAETMDVLRKCGARVVEITLDSTAFETKVFDILKYEFRKGVENFLKFNPEFPIKGLRDVIAFNEKNMAAFAPYNHEIIKQSKDEYYDDQVIKTQIKINQNLTRSALNRAFEKVDVLMTLSNYCTSVYAPAGYPAINVPGTYRLSGEPVGITLIGKSGDDLKLIEYAYAYESIINRMNPNIERSSK